MKQEPVESRGNQGCSSGAKVVDDVLEDFMQMRVLETVYEED